MSGTQSVFPLPRGAESMCAFCMVKATHFVIVSYSYGDLKPVCPDHKVAYGDNT